MMFSVHNHEGQSSGHLYPCLKKRGGSCADVQCSVLPGLLRYSQET